MTIKLLKLYGAETISGYLLFFTCLNSYLLIDFGSYVFKFCLSGTSAPAHSSRNFKNEDLYRIFLVTGYVYLKGTVGPKSLLSLIQTMQGAAFPCNMFPLSDQHSGQFIVD